MHYVGVDVSSATLEVAEAERAGTQTFANTKAGIAQLVRWLERASEGGARQVILEPTSTYHRFLAKRLHESGIPYTSINPARTAAYSRARGRRAKTDRVDARLLADLGARERPERTVPNSPIRESLKALCRHRNWAEAGRQEALNKLETAPDDVGATPRSVLSSLRRIARQLEREAARFEEEIERVVESDPALAQEARLLATIPAVARRTALLLVGEMPEVARCENAKTWVAFAGLNPEPRESGKMHYSRLSRMGSARIRSRLWMAAVVAQQCNPAVAALVERLKQRGKTGKLAVTAAMAKLVRICFGVLRNRRPFDPSMDERVQARKRERSAQRDRYGRRAHVSPPPIHSRCAGAHRRPELVLSGAEGRSGGPRLAGVAPGAILSRGGGEAGRS